MTNVPWDPSSSEELVWAQTAFELLQTGELDVQLRRRRDISTLTAVGSCPRCGHDVRFSQVRNAAIVSWRLGRRTKPPTADSAEYRQVDIRCTCNSPAHDGRPRESSGGCGLVFPVRVREKQS